MWPQAWAPNAGYALRRTNRAAFNQVMQHADNFFLRQNHAAKRLFLRFDERLATGQAAIALIAVSIFAVLLCRSVAGFAIHLMFSIEATQDQHYA
jgi:hypothetical protein